VEGTCCRGSRTLVMFFQCRFPPTLNLTRRASYVESLFKRAFQFSALSGFRDLFPHSVPNSLVPNHRTDGFLYIRTSYLCPDIRRYRFFLPCRVRFLSLICPLDSPTRPRSLVVCLYECRRTQMMKSPPIFRLLGSGRLVPTRSSLATD